MLNQSDGGEGCVDDDQGNDEVNELAWVNARDDLIVRDQSQVQRDAPPK